MVRNMCGQSCDGTLNLTLFQKWTDGMGLVKNGSGYFSSWDLKSAAS